MPLIIYLKEPPINLILDEEIKDGSEKEWDEIFQNGVLFMKTRKGDNMLVPLWKECNIACMKNATEEELEEMKEMKKQMEEDAKRRGGSLIKTPEFLFPSGRRNPQGR